MAEYFSYRDADLQVSYSRDETPVPSDFRMHTHESYELYYFLGGRGIYKIEGAQYPLERGDLLLMRPAEAHYIAVSPAQPYTRLSINFRPEIFRGVDPDGRLLIPFHRREAGSFNRYRAADFPSDAYRIFLGNLLTDGPDRRLRTLANLIPLLCEIAAAFRAREETAVEGSTEARIVRYVNRRLTEDLSLDDVCRAFFLSKSQLCRIFKRATGSTVWEYITVKRLVAARRMMQTGLPPTRAYLACGFRDYSAFYRAHCKRYGVPPSDFAAQK